MTQKKLRLDILLVQKELASTRQKAQALIGAGKVYVNGKLSDKAGHKFEPDAEIEIRGSLHPYVSRGGVKLAHAIDHFNIEVEGLVCMDVGASTGGFTDCLLQKKAKKVYSIDVGYGQFDWKLRNDARVVLMERTNIRHLEPGTIKEKIDLAVIDTSFISLKLVVPAVIPHLKPEGLIISLVKPQFEVGREFVGKGGIVKDDTLHEKVIRDLSIFFRENLKMKPQGVIPSPILGAKGNKEFLMLLGADI